MKYEYFQVIGLQRTGTNWLHFLIEKNFIVEPKISFWKHLTRLGIKNEFILYVAKNKRYDLIQLKRNKLKIDESVFYIVTQKDFSLWNKSLDRNPMDFYRSHNTQTDNPEKEVYNCWDTWKNENLHLQNFYYKDYTDWLKNWKIYFEEIEYLTGWKRKLKKFENVDDKLNEFCEPMRTFDISNYNL